MELKMYSDIIMAIAHELFEIHKFVKSLYGYLSYIIVVTMEK